MGGGCGPNCTTFTLNVPLSTLTEVELESIRESIIALLQDLGAGKVTVSFREGCTDCDASTENPVNEETLNGIVTEAGEIQTLGDSNFIIAKINGKATEYNNKLIIVKTDNDIAYVDYNVGQAGIVKRSDWEDSGITEDEIKHVAFGKDVTALGDQGNDGGGIIAPPHVFKDCENLETVTLSPETTHIGGLIFINCTSLKSFYITKKVISILSPGNGGSGPQLIFEGSSLESFYVDEENQKFYSVDGVLFSRLPTRGSVFVEAFPIRDPRTSYTVPEGVTGITSYAFYECTSLASITLPDGVIEIFEGAFEGCRSLASMTVPKGVTDMDGWGFKNCVKLETVTFEGGRQDDVELSFEMFSGCETLAAIDLPEKVLFDIVGFLPDEKSTSIFEGCTSLAKVTVRDPRVEEYLDSAFKDVPAVQTDTLGFNVANALAQIEFGADNGAFSDKSTELDPPNKLYFGADGSGGDGLKKVLLTPP